MQRKLASIQEITAIHPIANADAIEVVKILGWYVVVKKEDNFKVGDKVVYIEIDSVLPEKPEFEFLRKDKFRIRTVKMRGQISQGICFSLSILPIAVYGIGQDVTELVGVTKYEPPIPTCLDGLVKGLHPSFIPKTDETRVQWLQSVLTKYKGLKCYASEKIDGTSSTFYIYENEFGVCGHTREWLYAKNNAYWRVAEKYDMERKLRSLNREVALQGEIIMPGLQDNKYQIKPNGIEVYFFNAFDIRAYRYYNFAELCSLLKTLELPMVPIVNDCFELTDNIDDLVEMAKGQSKLLSVKREGIVIRPLIEVNDIEMGRLSFKAINPEFLLKYGE
jgi:RNA ligase (TIGR02306 family)